MSSGALTFSLFSSDIAQFAPRLGTVALWSKDGSSTPDIKTPGCITASSRGLVPHLSRDHVKSTPSIRWVNIPFESFLDRSPPVPTLQSGSAPFHTFLGYNPKQHILSMSARDPFDTREMPPNSKDHISAYCIRGVRKISPSTWKAYSQTCEPDVVVALSDTPFTQAPQSQKRLHKSVERSTAWLADFLSSWGSQAGSTGREFHRPNILVNLVGGTEERARTSFAENLVEVLHGKELEQISPLHTLDEGVIGYQFELLPLAKTLQTDRELSAVKEGEGSPDDVAEICHLMQASLIPLPTRKLRIAYGATSPHQILRYIQSVGIDLFDTHWAQHAAEIGIALDFRFPVTPSTLQPTNKTCPALKAHKSGKIDIGHNLFDLVYARDHSRLAPGYSDLISYATTSDSEQTNRIPVCGCGACSPVTPTPVLLHDKLTQPPQTPALPLPPYVRSYVHHLLHTHEMSSHTLLALHNLAVMDDFFTGVRETLNHPEAGENAFAGEVARFEAAYEDPSELFAEAEKDWARVEYERGKGRMAREREQQEASIMDSAATDL